MTRSARRGTLVLCLVAVALGAQLTRAQAQPYAAAGGFMRPARAAGPGVVATFATASHQGVMQAVWADTGGVWRRALFDTAAPSVQLAPAGSIRGVSATTAGGDIAVAWLERDLRTGRTRHSLQWRSRSYLLFETNLEVPMLIGEAAGSPWVLVAPRAEGRATLVLYRLSPAGELAEPVMLYSTTLNVTGVRAAGTNPELGGPAYLAWLEGRTSTGGLGSDSEWFAYVMATTHDAAPLSLGLADVIDVRQAAAVGEGPGGAVHALWFTVDGALEFTTLSRTNGRLEVETRQSLGEVGRPVGFVGEDVYWLSDAFIRRGSVAAGGGLVDVTSVVWSPVPVEDAVLFAVDRTTGATGAAAAAPRTGSDRTTTLGWYGREQGGKVSAYTSDDSAAFVPGLTDRIAALMKWSPWSVWQQALGQALTAVLAAITVTLGLAPVLFLLGLVVGRSRRVRGRPALTGAVLGIVTPIVILVLVGLRYPAAQFSSALTATAFLQALPWLLLGGAVGYLVARQRDTEAPMVVFMAACTAALSAITVLAFANYHTWAEFIGLI